VKKVSMILVGIFCLFLGIDKIFAAGSINVNKSSMYLGDSVTVSVTVTNAAAWEIHVGVSGSASASNCGTLNWADSDANAQNTSRTYTTTCKPTKTGSVNFVLSGNTTDAFGNTVNISGSRTVYINNKPTTPSNNTQTTKPNNSTQNNNGTVTPKSSVNYLKSLEIEGKQINPKFNKETLEYSIELESGTTSINIKATPEDNKANIVGTGIKKVTEGVNNFEIVVTAENGSKRTYKLKATVKEKDPIIVTVDNEEYTVIRKRDQLISASAFYSESTVKINDEDIPAYFGEVTGYTLVGLKNSEGIINLFIYDEDKNSYKLYREFNFSRTVFYPVDVSSKLIPKNYFKYTTTIDGIEVPCYKMDKDDEFLLLYGVNIENNNKGFYIYDPTENTLQRYNDKIFDKVNDEIKVLEAIIIGLVGVIIVIVIVAAFQGSMGKKGTKKTKKVHKAKKMGNIKEEVKENKVLEEPKVEKFDTERIDINDININK